MSHPKNHHERFEVGVRKGRKRVILWDVGHNERPNIEDYRRVWIQHHRDTTKICGGWCCKNPRRYDGALTRQELKEIERNGHPFQWDVD